MSLEGSENESQGSIDSFTPERSPLSIKIEIDDRHMSLNGNEGQEDIITMPLSPRTLRHRQLAQDRKELRQQKIEEAFVRSKSLEGFDQVLEDFISEGLQPNLRQVHMKTVLYTFNRMKSNFGIHGVKKEQLNSLLSFVWKGHVSRVHIKRFCELLVPRDVVSEDIFLEVVGRLKTDMDLQIMHELLEWMVEVFAFLETKDRLIKLYSVLFHYLQYSSLRPAISHLLYFMTRAEHVTPYRCNKLLEWLENERDSTSLVGLLQVYHTLNSKLQIPVNIRLKARYVYQHPKPEFAAIIKRVRIRADSEEESEDQLLFKPYIKLPDKKRTKRTRKSAQISRKINTEQVENDIVKANEEIGLEGFLALLQRVQRLDATDQIKYILSNRVFQHAIICDTREGIIPRLGFYIEEKLYNAMDVYDPPGAEKSELGELLKNLVLLNRFTKSQLPVTEDFLIKYLKTWNGNSHQEEIFELVSHLKPMDYKDLYPCFLKPLYRLYIMNDVSWKAKLLSCYGEMLKNWALLDWKAHTQLGMFDNEIDKLTLLFQGLSFDIDYFDTMRRLIEHSDRICVIGLLQEDDHPLLQHASLSFFEQVSTISLQHDIPEIVIPAAAFVHRSFFSTSAMPISRICGIMYQFKLAFEANDEKSGDWISRHTPEYLDHFNGYVMDICNSLWRNLGFSKQDQSASAFSLTEEIIENISSLCDQRGTKLNMILSLTHSATLAGFSKKFMKSLEDMNEVEVHHDQPITAAYLKKLEKRGGLAMTFSEYRVRYLEYLKDMGFDGIYDLLYSCMSSLIKHREILMTEKAALEAEETAIAEAEAAKINSSQSSTAGRRGLVSRFTGMSSNSGD